MKTSLNSYIMIFSRKLITVLTLQSETSKGIQTNTYFICLSTYTPAKNNTMGSKFKCYFCPIFRPLWNFWDRFHASSANNEKYSEQNKILDENSLFVTFSFAKNLIEQFSGTKIDLKC